MYIILLYLDPLCSSNLGPAPSMGRPQEGWVVVMRGSSGERGVVVKSQNSCSDFVVAGMTREAGMVELRYEQGSLEPAPILKLLELRSEA